MHSTHLFSTSPYGVQKGRGAMSLSHGPRGRTNPLAALPPLPQVPTHRSQGREYADTWLWLRWTHARDGLQDALCAALGG